jgi:uncharacterized protein (TIGR02594 family)
MITDPFHIALSQFGTREFAGVHHNPEVMKYFKEAGFDWVETDETGWCSAFINWCAMKAGYERSGKLNARSWLKVGQSCKPEMGCLVVLWRESETSWKGHVGFLVRETIEYVYILGGNQTDQVKITAYPKSRVLSYRKLLKIKI